MLLSSLFNFALLLAPQGEAWYSNLHWKVEIIPEYQYHTVSRGLVSKARPTVTLRIPYRRNGQPYKPSSVKELLELLDKSFSNEQKREILYRHGFSINGKSRSLFENHEIRIEDISTFLFRKFVDRGPPVLAKQLRCLSLGDEDFYVLYWLFTDREIVNGEGYTKREDLPIDVDTSAGRILARKVALSCGVNIDY